MPPQIRHSPHAAAALATFVFVAFLLPTLAYAATFADTVYLGGNIRTLDANDRLVQAVAVADGKILAVGTDEAIRQHIGAKTQVVDLKGATVMPGIIDAHGHYVRGALRGLFSCVLSPQTPVDDIAPKVKECVQKVGPGGWVSGGGWANGHIGTGKIHRSQLDAVSPDNPVYLLDGSGQIAYVNSKALEILGLTKETAATREHVLKDASGEPNGLLTLEAASQALSKIPPLGSEKYEAAVRWSAKEANRFGITTFAEARADRRTVEAFAAVDRAGQLSANVVTFLMYDTEFNETQAVQEETVRNRAQYRTAHVYTDFVKLYLDGVPITYSGALLEPYEHDDNHPADFRGQLRMKPERIQQDLVEMDRIGITVKMHATGDASVRVGLDAIESARKANPSGQLPHQIAHVGLVAPSDLPRFKQLRAVADISPPIWIPGPYSQSVVATIGQARYERYIPTADLLHAGALVAYGSDWPAVAASFNPWPHLESLVDRSIGPAQRIPLRDAVATMTIGAATALRLEQRVGSIEVGKSADMVVLDRDPFQVQVSQIGGTQVQLTIFEGRDVYRRDDSGTRVQ
jgi:predicted amidohydrolase YtcJ